MWRNFEFPPTPLNDTLILTHLSLWGHHCAGDFKPAGSHSTPLSSSLHSPLHSSQPLTAWHLSTVSAAHHTAAPAAPATTTRHHWLQLLTATTGASSQPLSATASRRLPTAVPASSTLFHPSPHTKPSRPFTAAASPNNHSQLALTTLAASFPSPEAVTVSDSQRHPGSEITISGPLSGASERVSARQHHPSLLCSKHTDAPHHQHTVASNHAVSTAPKRYTIHSTP